LAHKPLVHSLLIWHGAPDRFFCTQEPFWQNMVAEHWTPQAPQLVSVLRLVSQPLAGMPSQSAKPELQTRPHAPLLQTAVEFGPEGQTLPQPPQWFASVRMLVSQPLAGLPSQSAKPVGHVPAQPAPMLLQPFGQQIGPPLVPTQVLLPGGQPHWVVPDMQTMPGGQQVCGAVVPPQIAWPAGQQTLLLMQVPAQHWPLQMTWPVGQLLHCPAALQVEPAGQQTPPQQTPLWQQLAAEPVPQRTDGAGQVQGGDAPGVQVEFGGQQTIDGPAGHGTPVAMHKPVFGSQVWQIGHGLGTQTPLLPTVGAQI
jgi:hypothetical protein